MHITVRTSDGFSYQITSSDPAIIGSWFAEQVPSLISANTLYNHPLTVDVWPNNDDEFKAMHQHDHVKQGKASWLNLIDYLAKLVDAMPDD